MLPSNTTKQFFIIESEGHLRNDYRIQLHKELREYELYRVRYKAKMEEALIKVFFLEMWLWSRYLKMAVNFLHLRKSDFVRGTKGLMSQVIEGVKEAPEVRNRSRRSEQVFERLQIDANSSALAP